MYENRFRCNTHIYYEGTEPCPRCNPPSENNSNKFTIWSNVEQDGTINVKIPQLAGCVAKLVITKT